MMSHRGLTSIKDGDKRRPFQVPGNILEAEEASLRFQCVYLDFRANQGGGARRVEGRV